MDRVKVETDGELVGVNASGGVWIVDGTGGNLLVYTTTSRAWYTSHSIIWTSSCSSIAACPIINIQEQILNPKFQQ